MSSLSATPDYAEASALYLANAGYEEDGSVTAAKAFISACKALIFLRPKRAKEGGGSETEFDPASLKQQLEAAQSYVAANSSTTGSVRHASFENFRD